MYYTLKLHIKATQQQKEQLLLYEKVYHEQIENLCRQMIQGKYQFRHLKYSKSIHLQNRWLLYQYSCQRYKALCLSKHFRYHRSSSWSPASFHQYDYSLELLFGTDFSISSMILNLSIDHKESDLLNKGRTVRIDLVHDEKYWFANFIIHNDDS